MSIIEDGRGTGQKALVDDHGRLATKAVIVGHLSHHATYHKNSYRQVFETTLADSNEAVCFLLYNSDAATDIEIYDITMSSDANVEIVETVNETYASGGNSIEYVNTNLGSNKQPSVVSYEGGASDDLVTSTTNSSNIGGQFISASKPYHINMDGSVVVTFKKSYAIRVTGSAGNKVKITVQFAVHEAGTEL